MGCKEKADANEKPAQGAVTGEQRHAQSSDTQATKRVVVDATEYVPQRQGPYEMKRYRDPAETYGYGDALEAALVTYLERNGWNRWTLEKSTSLNGYDEAYCIHRGYDRLYKETGSYDEKIWIEVPDLLASLLLETDEESGWASGQGVVKVRRIPVYARGVDEETRAAVEDGINETIRTFVSYRPADPQTIADVGDWIIDMLAWMTTSAFLDEEECVEVSDGAGDDEEKTCLHPGWWTETRQYFPKAKPIFEADLWDWGTGAITFYSCQGAYAHDLIEALRQEIARIEGRLAADEDEKLLIHLLVAEAVGTDTPAAKRIKGDDIKAYADFYNPHAARERIAPVIRSIKEKGVKATLYPLWIERRLRDFAQKLGMDAGDLAAALYRVDESGEVQLADEKALNEITERYVEVLAAEHGRDWWRLDYAQDEFKEAITKLITPVQQSKSAEEDAEEEAYRERAAEIFRRILREFLKQRVAAEQGN